MYKKGFYIGGLNNPQKNDILINNSGWALVFCR